MRSPLITTFLALVCLCGSSCKKIKPAGDSRSFLLGVTPWPPDFTKKGYDLSYDFINGHCDIVSHHFDDGLPWEEIYKGQALPGEFLKDVGRRKDKTRHGGKVLLSVAPLKISRKERAGYYDQSAMPDSVRSAWNARGFRDTAVIAAYVKFISYLVQELGADYINYGVESNSKDWDPENFSDFKYFLGQVHAQLTALYPDKPFFISFMVAPEAGFLEKARELEPYTDWITLSAYPYSYVGSPVHGASSPELIPQGLFQSFVDINSAKPFAMAETGYIAEDLSITSLSKEGTARWQEDYVNYLFKFCQANKAKFIIWFCAYDYDDAINTFSALGLTQDLFYLWKDTGLFNEKLEARPAYQVWEAWRKLPVES
jgi:hypothetical protein